MSTQERKLELERKKAKLAALRDSRNKREKVRSDLYMNGSPNSLSTSASAQDLRAEAEEMLRNLGFSVDTIGSKRHRKLAMCLVNEINVAPKSPIQYSKQTQTRDANILLPHSVSLQHSESPREIIGSPKFIAHLEWDDEFSTGLTFDETLPEPSDQTDMTLHLNQTGDSQIRPNAAEEIPKVIVLGEEDRNLVMATSRFQSFFDHASRICERALTHVDDIFIDYTGADQDRNRCNKQTPVQRTLLSATAHTHPVKSVMVVGTQNAHSLISISSDGKLCSWSLEMLSQPNQYMELMYRQTRTVGASCMCFLHHDVDHFLVGSEDGRVYTGSRHENKAGVTESFEGHQAYVTSVSAHTTEGPVDFSHLFLTSSFDWSVKLWSTKVKQPLLSFNEATDFTMDTPGRVCHC
ncbi:unnamed protein product [Echinostoma caproni]|uniref:WD_REPEATS_REGION domain-containing protein n=1 Tax=Echinostoma caproni TaxID=27848 RepID=A0A183AJV0_9TREM|nr:unnamed protein product [Echinostoma caproni]